MKAFWALAAAHWPLSLPRRRLEGEFGAQCIEALLASRVLLTGTLHEEETIPCAVCRWPARLVLEDDDLVAICTGPEGCSVEHLGARPERLFLEPEVLARELATALRLEGSPGAPETVTPLGQRAFGEDVVAFDLVTNPARVGVFDALYRLARNGPRHRVVFTPSSTRLAADLPTEMGGAQLAWAGLDEAVFVGDIVTVDLRRVLRMLDIRDRGAPAAFAGLLLTGAGASWAGRSLPVEGAPLALRLLRALAQAPGAYVSRRELWRALYPGEHAPSGRVTPGVNPDDLDDRLRAVVGKLRSAFRGLGSTPGLPDDIIENRRGDEKAGGYRLALPPDLVRIER